MKYLFVSFIFGLSVCVASSQDHYKNSLNSYIANYVNNHEVVTGEDKKLLSFYPVNEQYRIVAKFERVRDGKWFSMETSGPLRQVYRVYGTIYFTIRDTVVRLNIYQSQMLMTTEQYKDHLLLPYTDLTTGDETYPGGRYIDLETADVKNNSITIDFNKAYNPYCAYITGKYNCPLPPKENDLPVAIRAGEKLFVKSH